MEEELIMWMTSDERKMIEDAAEATFMDVDSFVKQAIYEAVDAIRSVDTVYKLEVTPLEMSLIEYAAGFNGLGLDEEGRGVAEFIRQAIMDAVGETVEDTLEQPDL